jgi:hypothetical protein
MMATAAAAWKDTQREPDLLAQGELGCLPIKA